MDLWRTEFNFHTWDSEIFRRRVLEGKYVNHQQLNQITERSTGDFPAGNKKTKKRKVMVLLQAKPFLKLSSWHKFY